MSFWGNVEKTETCWNWVGYVTPYGYGNYHPKKGVKLAAHRVTYEMFKGPIPEGKEIDHLCRNRRCVNPDHLEAVTRQVNMLRGDTIAAKHAAKIACPRGHPYSGTRIQYGRKSRICHTCNAACERRRLARIKEAHHSAL